MIVTHEKPAAKTSGLTATPLMRLQRAQTLYEIHNATCRARQAGLCCSQCSDLAERVERLEARRG